MGVERLGFRKKFPPLFDEELIPDVFARTIVVIFCLRVIIAWYWRVVP